MVPELALEARSGIRPGPGPGPLQEGSARPVCQGPSYAPRTWGFWDVLIAGCKIVNSEKAFSLFSTVNSAHKTDGGAGVDCFTCVNEQPRACL